MTIDFLEERTVLRKEFNLVLDLEKKKKEKKERKKRKNAVSIEEKSSNVSTTCTRKFDRVYCIKEINVGGRLVFNF